MPWMLRWLWSCSLFAHLANAAAPVVQLTSGDAISTALRGQPPVEKFAIPSAYNPENYDVLRASDGRIYVANVDGLLIFDGEHWQFVAMPNQDLVRSLAEADGVVYVGGYSVLGRVQIDAYGRAQFEDLTPKVLAFTKGRAFADIWNTETFEGQVYFRSLRDLFLFDPRKQSFRHWYHEGKFGAIEPCNGQMWLQFRGEGYRRFDGQQWQVVPHSNLITKLSVSVRTPSDQLLIVDADNRWFALDQQSLRALQPASGAPPPGTVHKMMRLPADEIAMVGSEGKLYVTNAELSAFRSYNIDSSFLAGIAEIDSALLFAGAGKVMQIPWPSTISELFIEAKDRSSINHSAIRGGELLVFTDAGALRSIQDADGLNSLVPTFPGQDGIYDALALGDSMSLLADSHDLVVHRDGQRHIKENTIYPRRFFDSLDPTLKYLATEHGLRTLRIPSVITTNTPMSTIPTPGALESDNLVLSLLQTDPRTLWGGTERSGFWRYALSTTGEIAQALSINPSKLQGYAGLDFGEVLSTSVSVVDGAPLFCTSVHCYRLQQQQFQVEASTEALLAMRLRGKDTLMFYPTPSLTAAPYWARAKTQLFYRDPQGQWHELKNRPAGIYAIAHIAALPDQQLLITGSQGVAIYDTQELAITERKSKADTMALTSVWRINAVGDKSPLPLQPTTSVVLDTSDLGVRFEFALRGMRAPGSTAYRGQLLGYESEMSDWSPGIGYTYTRLRPGAYQMKLQAQLSDGSASEANLYPITFPHAWHQRTWARVALVTAGLVLLSLLTRTVVRWRTRRLQHLVAERTQDLAQANAKLDAMAHLDQLTNVPNRRRMDEYLHLVWENCLQRGHRLAVLLIDADRFKAYNDQHGHLAGDALLRSIAQILQQSLRRTEDLLARYGGEEFLVILPTSSPEFAAELAQQMRGEIEKQKIGVTVSIGYVVAIPKAEHTPAAFIAAADQALYQAKATGRNRVVAADQFDDKTKQT